ncbi:curli assembly protein CsgF [Aureimonas glaciei]|uniref:Curli production assembly/transport component CsgF n=1 Tax=Aureimonas glaciei TaxID=1776957 RepID=A0A917D7T0_9HYPH|nr:curli assembly protein CsgF [Aureimonas glaciei]GGD04906.1 hypothetical protein GCM10011335_04670 [Aureimonas glaciei]
MTQTFLRLAGVLAFTVLAAGSTTSASELVYRPINPSFGGDAINGNWLLSQATAQAPGAGSGTGGFTIDFPDFGSIPQTTPTDPTTLPEVPITTPVVGN